MARTNTQSFDIAAYLNSNTKSVDDSKSLFATVAEKTENLVKRGVYRAGKSFDQLAGSGEIFEAGRKVGKIAAAKSVQDFKQRAYDEIEALLK